MSLPIEKWTTSAGWPAATARLWSPEAPNELVKLAPDPAEGLLEGRLEAFFVDGLGGGVADDGDLFAAGRAAASAAGDDESNDQRKEAGHQAGVNAALPGVLARVPHRRVPSYVD